MIGHIFFKLNNGERLTVVEWRKSGKLLHRVVCDSRAYERSTRLEKKRWWAAIHTGIGGISL
jgi:hypothetical protein